MEFESVSRRLNAYAAAAEVDTLSITKDGVELRGTKALQTATDSLFQAIKNGTDHTTAAIPFLADPEFNRDTVRIEHPDDPLPRPFEPGCPYEVSKPEVQGL